LERTPTIILSKAPDPGNLKPTYSSVDQSGRVRPGSTGPERSALQDAPLLYNDIVGEFDLPIIVHESPVQGGVHLRNLQDQAGDIPLWRDHIPELSIGAIVDGLWETIPLVGTHTNVRPIRGREVEIPIPEERRAPLGPGITQFDFPLSQGRSENKIGYAAFLASPSFPLSTTTRFKLKLTYTYGADDPYKLQFLAEGKDGSRDTTIPPIIAAWRPVTKRTESELERLPLPDFEEKVAWELLTRWPSIKTNHRTGRKEWDFLTAIEESLFGLTIEGQVDGKRDWIDSKFNEIRSTRTAGTVTGFNRDKNGKFFVFAEVMGEEVFCHETRFIENINPVLIQYGDRVFMNVDRSTGKTQGQNVTFTGVMPHEAELSLRAKLGGRKANKIDYKVAKKKVYRATFPSHMVWNRGRSIAENDCPPQFRNAVVVGRERAQQLHDSDATPIGLRKEIFKFLSKMHKDAPQETIVNLERISQKKVLSRMELQCLAWSMGGCSELWQKEILERVLKADFAETTYVLSIAFLKCPNIVGALSLQDLKSLLHRLNDEIASELSIPPSPDGVQKCAYIFEVLLALLFTRQSEDSETKHVLSPESEFGLLFTDAIDRVARIVRDNGFTPRSRIELTNSAKAPDEAWQPDLLVALRRTLTGSDGTTALRISWNSDSDSDSEEAELEEE